MKSREDDINETIEIFKHKEVYRLGIAEGRRLQKIEDDKEELTPTFEELAFERRGYAKALADVKKKIDSIYKKWKSNDCIRKQCDRAPCSNCITKELKQSLKELHGNM